MTLERQTLKKKIYTTAEVKTWLTQKQNIKADITAGETGEAFAVFFYPSTSLTRQDLKKVIGHIARLLDKDKPFSRVSSIRMEPRGGKTAIRIGWSV